MNILAVDTALGACSAAVLSGDKIIAHCFDTMDRGHAEVLAPMVQAAMRASGISFSALDRLGVTTGPGTFTGQRVGLAFMRGLRVALKRPLIGITTLEAMCAAAMAESATPFAAAIHDAKRDEAYLAIVSPAAMLLKPKLIALEAVPEKIRELVSNSSVALAGTGAALIAQSLVHQARLTAVRQPDALWVARLAAQALEPSGVPHPLYLRAPDAKLPLAIA